MFWTESSCCLEHLVLFQARFFIKPLTSPGLPLDKALTLYPCGFITPTIWSVDVNIYVCVCGPLTFFSKFCSLPNASEHFLFVPTQLFWLLNVTQQIPALPFFLMPASFLPQPTHKHTFTSLLQNAYQALNSQTMISPVSIHTGNRYFWGFIRTEL